MNEKEEFTAHWSHMDTSPPSSGTRCLVSDGDVVVIATYLTDNETKEVMWIFNGLNEGERHAFDVQGWMPLPPPIRRVVEPPKEKIIEMVNEKSVAKNKANN